MFARAAARAARRGWSAASVPGAPSRVRRRLPRPTRRFLAFGRAMDVRGDDGHGAAGGGIGEPRGVVRQRDAEPRRPAAHRARPGARKRTRIEGPNVPRARAVLVPLCHDEATGAPHVLFTVAPDDFGAPHVGFPGAPIARTVRPRDAHSVSSAIRDALDALGVAGADLTPDTDAEASSQKTRSSDASGALFDRLEILGLSSDCPDVPRQTAVTPVVGYLGRLDVLALERNAAARASERNAPALMAMSLEVLLSRESVDERVVPGVGPMPVFNAHAPPERPLQIWGLTAQILHAVMRVVVGPRAEYADAPRRSRENQNQGAGFPADTYARALGRERARVNPDVARYYK